MADNKPTKEGLKTELGALLASAHGELKEKGEQIAKALDDLVAHDNAINREVLATALRETMTISDTKNLKVKDLKHMLTFMEHVATFLQSGLKNLHEFNDLVKKEQKKLKDRIKEAEEHRRGLRM